GRLPDDLVAEPRDEEGDLGARAAAPDVRAEIGGPASLGAEVGVAAGLPEAVVEGRRAEGGAGARLEPERPRGDGLEVEAEPRAERSERALAAGGAGIDVGAEGGVEEQLPEVGGGVDERAEAGL